MLHLYDTASREVRELALREPGTVSMYLCGPTVYGPPHLGHGRATLVYDVLRRYLEWSGLTVRLVSNITDIDDSIINRANREQRPWQEITHKCEAVWFEAMGKINVARPTDVPHATEYVVEMVEMIGQLIDNGTAPVWYVDPQDPGQKYMGPYDNPLPHVLILTAIVVSVSVLAVALALIINIRRAYGTIEADQIDVMDQEDRLAEFHAGAALDAADAAEVAGVGGHRHD